VSNNRIEELRAVITDESTTPEQREEARKVLAELEGQSKTNRMDQLDLWLAKIDENYADYVSDQNARFRVCGSCHRKQFKDRDTCELCAAASWQPAVVDSSDGRRSRLIWAASEATGEQLNWYVEHSSMDIAYVQHCARILELRGIARVRSFWECAGFTMLGRPIP
jgi:hypothetical protein